jgi:GT2 family glycosyltransferase
VAAWFRREPFLAFSDDDSWWAPGALDLAAELMHRHRRLAVLAARVLVGPEARLDPTCGMMGQSPLAPAPDLPGRPVLGFLACGAVVRREAFLAAGGFHPRLGVGGEEWLLAIDLSVLGWGVAYVPEVVAHHHPPGGRDPGPRRVHQLRNQILCAWLRRRPATAFRVTAAALASIGDREVRSAVTRAAGQLGWALRERRPVPRRLERDLMILESRTYRS